MPDQATYKKMNIVFIIAAFFLSSCGKNKATDQQLKTERQSQTAKISSQEQRTSKNTALQFQTLEWTDLMPKEDLDALLNPPSYITEVNDLSIEDRISSKLKNTQPSVKNDRYQQALSSTQIIEKMDGLAIRLPGFIVPLSFGDDQRITTFFLVPFFGACLHIPPPPPNQIIFVNYPEGLKLDALYDPFWISGVLKIELIENETAKSAYSMQMHAYEKYQERR